MDSLTERCYTVPMTDTIWMMGWAVPDDFGTDVTLDPNLGFALTEEQTQKMCDSLNRHLHEIYNADNAFFERDYYHEMMVYHDKLADYQVLKAAGRPAVEPVAPSREWLVPYDKWIEYKEHWIPVKIQTMKEAE